MIDNGVTPDSRLLAAVTATFADRDTELPGVELPSMAAAWRSPFAELAIEVNLSTLDAFEAHRKVEAFWSEALA